MTHSYSMPGKKLLVADDSLTIQKVIRLALSNEGYEIQAISDGADAIEQIATFRPDVVLIDVSLPSRSAFEIKREANSMPDHQGIKFILMSSAFEKIDEAQAEEVHFDARLTKPFDPAHLRQILAEVIHAPAAPKAFPASGPTVGIQLEPPPSLPPELPRTLPPELPPELPNDEIWGKFQETPPAAPQEDDIKQLTESTVRMSGLADIPNIKPEEEFEWQLNEPSMKPPSSFEDLGGSSFHIEPPTLQKGSALNEELSSPPPTPAAASARESTEDPSPQMEEMIRRQVQKTLEATLEKMAKQILPEVAERVIKAEISRLLNEKV